MIEYAITITFFSALVFFMLYSKRAMKIRSRKMDAWIESDEARDRIIKEMIEINKRKNND